MQVDKKRRLESLLFLYLKSKKKGNQYEKIMKKRPHDFLWRGSQMESKLMPGKEVTQQRTHNSKTFDLGRGAYQTVIYPETVHFKDAEGQWKEIDNNTTSDTPDATYTFDYDEFGNPTTVKVGNRVLSTNVYARYFRRRIWS